MKFELEIVKFNADVVTASESGGGLGKVCSRPQLQTVA